MKHTIVAISREFGSGGRTIGKELAARLGISCYDSELLEKIADKSGFTRDFVEKQGEESVGRGWLSQVFSARDYRGRSSSQDTLWAIQRKTILELAEKESCVIVGRCADYILRDREDCLRVFVHADPAVRAKRIVEQYGEREDSPEKRIRDKDKRRITYYQFYTDLKWGDAHNYHITLDSGLLGIDRCVEILDGLCEGRKSEKQQ